MNLGSKVSAAQVALAFYCMSDAPQSDLDVVVVHGLSQGMYESGDLFNHTLQLQGRYQCPVAVVGGDGRATGGTVPKASWIGHDDVVRQLVMAGIRGDLIFPIDPITNSKEEALAIVRMAELKQLTRVGSVSVAYHGGRMFPYMVAAMQEVGYWFEYYMLPPARTDWWLDIVGSQGAYTTNCVEATMADAVKIENHIEQGFAAPFDEVFFYLRHRAEISRTQVWEPVV